MADARDQKRQERAALMARLTELQGIAEQVVLQLGQPDICAAQVAVVAAQLARVEAEAREVTAALRDMDERERRRAGRLRRFLGYASDASDSSDSSTNSGEAQRELFPNDEGQQQAVEAADAGQKAGGRPARRCSRCCKPGGAGADAGTARCCSPAGRAAAGRGAAGPDAAA